MTILWNVDTPGSIDASAPVNKLSGRVDTGAGMRGYTNILFAGSG